MSGEANHPTTLATALRAGVPAGVLATAIMDIAMLATGRLAGGALASDRLGPGIIGRWAAGLLHGRWQHEDITGEPALAGETALGVATHYATGVMLTEVYLIARRRREPSLPTAVRYGIGTAALPLLILFPSLGYGWFGRRSGEAARIDLTMLLGHLAFGIGIGLGARRFLRSP